MKTMNETKNMQQNTLFADPDFQILHYWDSEESLFVAIKRKDEQGNSIFPNQTLTEIIKAYVKPALREILEREISGYFDPTYSFSMEEKFVLLNGQSDLAVCNI